MTFEMLLTIAVRTLGILAAVAALFTTRSAQGATAWVIALISYPYVALPLYALFGLNRFRGYVRARRFDDDRLRRELGEISRKLKEQPLSPDTARYKIGVFEQLADLRLTPGNRAELLVDGAQTFDAILAAIDQARSYVLVEFYIVKDDATGRRLLDGLARARARGVRVLMLYDWIGSYRLSRAYRKALDRAGVEHDAFRSTRGLGSRIQANFRNHRKIVVVDGTAAFVGGHNVGDEYMGLDPKIGHWRDTHLKLEGVVALQAQLVFLEDWFWTRHEIPDFLQWTMPEERAGEAYGLILASGPVDEMVTAAAMFAQALGTARERLWLATPYFAPDLAMLIAIQLAHLRGVDVRILVTKRSDNLLSDLASSTYLPEALTAGARIFRYEGAFMHQKVFLVDDSLAAVTSANFDVRSFRLNFEVSALVNDRGFAGEVRRMLEADLARSTEVRPEDFARVPFPRQVLARTARLLTPVI